jgi:hypothetical protein
MNTTHPPTHMLSHRNHQPRTHEPLSPLKPGSMAQFRPFEGGKRRRYDGSPSCVTTYDGCRNAMHGDDDYDDSDGDGDVANCGLTILWEEDVISDENLCMHANASFFDSL